MPALRPNRALADDLRRTGRAASREENDALIERVRAKDPEAIRQMVVSNSALVIRKARAFLRSRPKLTPFGDDMIANGFVALIEATRRLADSEPGGNVTGYLSVAINRAFLDFQDGQTSASARTVRAKRAAGEQLPQAVPLDDLDPAYDSSNLAELREEIEAACRSEDDLTIVRMRAEGYSDREIGETIGKSTSAVFAARKAIEARFNARQQ